MTKNPNFCDDSVWPNDKKNVCDHRITADKCTQQQQQHLEEDDER